MFSPTSFCSTNDDDCVRSLQVFHHTQHQFELCPLFDICSSFQITEEECLTLTLTRTETTLTRTVNARNRPQRHQQPRVPSSMRSLRKPLKRFEIKWRMAMRHQNIRKSCVSSCPNPHLPELTTISRTEDKTKIYSLYKQATSGDVQGTQPWAFEFEVSLSRSWQVYFPYRC